ncbi:MAG: cytochrome c family protein, partial [Syntrophales bacterium]|nr:cytochrome c family protein [Syntrophales bacterium]
MVKRPSNELALCGECHQEIAANYKKSLHYTTIGQRNRVIKRMSKEEAKIFDEKVFEKSCRSCHASCGDCHVKSPAIAGVSLGLINKHKFVRKDEGKTCAYCH